MHCCILEVTQFPPPLGINGALTFAVLPMRRPGPADPSRAHGGRNRADRRPAAYPARAGSRRSARSDWSHVLGRPVGVTVFLAGATEEEGTPIFVFEVIGANRKTLNYNDDPAYMTQGHVALTGQRMGPDRDYLTLALLRDGPWPPADSSPMCASYSYAPGIVSPRDWRAFPAGCFWRIARLKVPSCPGPQPPGTPSAGRLHFRRYPSFRRFPCPTFSCRVPLPSGCSTTPR